MHHLNVRTRGLHDPVRAETGDRHREPFDVLIPGFALGRVKMKLAIPAIDDETGHRGKRGSIAAAPSLEGQRGTT